jgi:endonuclease YncB( thermonuclease family)
MRAAVLALCTLVLCATGYAQQPPHSVGDLISGQVTSVASGAEFRLGYNRVRIWGITVPGRRAKCTVKGTSWHPAWDSVDALKVCLGTGTVTCRIQRIEPRVLRPRFVAECWRDSDKQDLAGCMVRAGWATDYTGYSSGYYAPLEAEPKAARRGLWQCDGEPPAPRWCNGGNGVPCEQPAYKPLGPPAADQM